MDNETQKYLFESLSNQLNVLRGEIKEDLQSLRFDLVKSIEKQDAKNEERTKFENKLLGAFGVFLLFFEVAALVLR